MVFRGREIALFLGVLGAFGQFSLPFAALGIGAVALRGLLPVVDLLLQRSLCGVVAGRTKCQFALLGRGLHRRVPNALGLKERPEIRCLDILAEGFGLRSLAK